MLHPTDRSEASERASHHALAIALRQRAHFTLLHLVVVVLGVGVPTPVASQSEVGTAASTLGGAALGGFSGATLGLLGSLEACNRTLLGAKCAAGATAVGGAFGMVAGGVLGDRSAEAVGQRLEGAAFGAAIGLVVGVGMRSVVRQYQWADAAAFGVVGAAIGAVPRGTFTGAGIGLVAGALTGFARGRPILPDAAMLMLVGGAVGGLVDWADGAADARRHGPVLTSSFAIAVR